MVSGCPSVSRSVMCYSRNGSPAFSSESRCHCSSPRRDMEMARFRTGDGDPACAPSRMFHPNTGGHDPSLDSSPPWKKPAFGNGPLATVVQDPVSVLIYFDRPSYHRLNTMVNALTHFFRIKNELSPATIRYAAWRTALCIIRNRSRRNGHVHWLPSPFGIAAAWRARPANRRLGISEVAAAVEIDRPA
jgi:hypothetical protein